VRFVAAVCALALTAAGSPLEAQRGLRGETRVSDVAQLVVADVGPLGKRYSVYRYEGVLVSGDMPVTEYRRAMAAATPLVGQGERIFEVTGTSAVQAVPGFPADLEVRTCTNCDFLAGAADSGAGRVFRFKRNGTELTLVGSYAWGER
jgi:hypothetical protein